MMITDHINLTGQNPLVGANHDRWGPRFPDMSAPYDESLVQLAQTIALEKSIALRTGTYAGVLGPTYETRAEIKMLETLGASAVGMSTVHEVIALRHQGIRVVGISCITNHAAGKGNETLKHQDVARVAAETSQSFCALVEELCQRLS
jgi:purine-nucleoside phosphorylase